MSAQPDATLVLEVERFARGVVTHVTETDDPSSLDAFLPLVYDEFRELAARLMRWERPDHTLRPTALAHEAYIRLAEQANAQVANPTHVLALAATAMRRILIDHARAKRTAKRGGSWQRVTLSDVLGDSDEGRVVDAVALDDALRRLADEAPRAVRAVELLYFAGLTYEESAAALEVSVRTVVRDWRFARAWLWRELGTDDAGTDGSGAERVGDDA